MKLYFSLLNKQEILAPVFRWSNPTLVSDLAKAIIELSLSGAYGIHHVCGSTFIDRYSWFKVTSEYLGWDSSLVMPKEKQGEDDKLRPERINLDTNKFRKVFKTRLHSLEESLVFLKQDIAKNG
jgi:dTDP-4-dehydrorhamnose reductase